jgi:NOL1/NOP2/fmu family ribosome biogenesis protein
MMASGKGAVMATSGDTFERKEKKYLITAEQCEAIKAGLANRMALDAYGATRIDSLYLDTPDRSLICRSLEKPLYKEKLRIRSYGAFSEAETVYVEIKKKYKGIVYKRRVRMSREGARAYALGMPYEQAQEQWSEDNVALCEARQRRIIADVWPALAPGGIFVYSTCTFNVHENDGNVRWTAEELGAEPLFADDRLAGMPGVIRTGLGYSLVPGFVEGEGQYCSALRKTSEEFTVPVVRGRGRNAVPAQQKSAMPEHWHGFFNVPVRLKSRADVLIAVPEGIWQDVSVLEGALHVIASGCAAGSVKGKDFIPNADLALSLMLADGAYPAADVDRDTALAFLHRDAVVLPGMERGFILLRYEGIPLGFVKNIGNRCNNLHPQSRRIRMNIK